MDLEEIWRSHYPSWAHRNIDIPDVSIYHALEDSVKKFGELTAIDFMGTKIT